MKTIHLTIICLILLLSQCRQSPISGGTSTDNNDPKITIAEGLSIVAKQTNIERASIGLPVSDFDTLITGAKSKIQVTFNDSDYIIIGENSKVTVLTTSDSTIISIIHGKVYSNAVILPKKTIYKIITPNYKTRVKGTAFTVESDSGKTNVTVFEGKVEVENRICPIQVLSGERLALEVLSPCQSRVVKLKELEDIYKWVGSGCMKLRKRIDLVSNIEFVKKLAKIDSTDLEIQAIVKISNIDLSGSYQKDDTINKESFVTSPLTTNSKDCKPMTVDSLRNPSDITLTIQETTLPQINFMYKRVLRSLDKQINGEITVKFSINSFGTVEKTEILNSTINDTLIQNRVLTIIQETKFKQIDNKVGTTSVVFPFTFASN